MRRIDRLKKLDDAIRVHLSINTKGELEYVRFFTVEDNFLQKYKLNGKFSKRELAFINGFLLRDRLENNQRVIWIIE